MLNNWLENGRAVMKAPRSAVSSLANLGTDVSHDQIPGWRTLVLFGARSFFGWSVSGFSVVIFRDRLGIVCRCLVGRCVK